jgi:hypothetical protein
MVRVTVCHLRTHGNSKENLLSNRPAIQGTKSLACDIWTPIGRQYRNPDKSIGIEIPDIV